MIIMAWSQQEIPNKSKSATIRTNTRKTRKELKKWDRVMAVKSRLKEMKQLQNDRITNRRVLHILLQYGGQNYSTRSNSTKQDGIKPSEIAKTYW